ncbi:MAG: ABC transporter permease [Treponemataceae bacterium]|nr:ABC transporter permease [Treponemataceae bacterium]
MNKTLHLALRNLTRQKRRNAILAIAIAFGFFVVTAIDGLTAGMVGNLEDMITQMTGGSVMIAGYEKIPSENGDGKDQLVHIVRDKSYIQKLVEDNDIDYKYFSRFTRSGGQLLFNGKKSMVTMYGRDLSEPELLDTFQVIAGSLDNLSDPHALVIGKSIADSMNLEPGDSVVYSTSTVYGQNEVGDFTVAAIIKENNLLSSMQTYTHIKTLNALVGLPEDGYSSFSIFLKDRNKQDAVAAKLENLIRQDGIPVSSRLLAYQTNPNAPAAGITKQFSNDEYQWEGTKYGVETLSDAIPQIKTILSIVHIVTTVILLVILLIVMVGVSNTYRMVLYERIREIGTMRAVGMTGKTTGKVFTTEAVVLCVIGALMGLVLSILVMGIIHLIPIHNESLSFFLHNGHFTFSLSLGTVIVQYLLLIALTTLAVRGTAKKAAALSPAEALRSIK